MGGVDAMNSYSFSFNLFFLQKRQYWPLQWFLLGVDIPVFVSIQYWGRRECFLADYQSVLGLLLGSHLLFFEAIRASSDPSQFLSLLPGFWSFSLRNSCPFYCPLVQDSTQDGLVQQPFQGIFMLYAYAS